ncbi:MAG: DUF1273 family protein [Clostridia bacterium]|nr:DUF1273 family protein [Clostridia bacterium]
MGRICCFAGHSELYGESEIYTKVVSVIENLILTENINEFWVGNYGSFDKLCARAVRELKEKYSDIQLNLVIPYLTVEINAYKEQYYRNFDNILIADIPEKTPKNFKIIKSNEYMVQNSKVLVCYVEHFFGGAAKTVEYAKKRRNIKIVNVADNIND